MEKLRKIFLASGVALALGGCGCTPSSLLQPPPAKVSWAEDREENVPRNSTEIGKFAGSITDDTTGGAAPKAASTAPNQPKEAPAEAPRGQKQIPLSEHKRPTMPPPPTHPKFDQPPAAAGTEESEDVPSPKTGPPPPAATSEQGRTLPTGIAAEPGPAPQAMPQGGKLLPANVGAPFSGKPLPPYFRQTPTAMGEMLHLGPYDNPAQAAVEYALKLSAADIEIRSLSEHLKRLEADLESRERSLSETTGEVEQATAEIVKSRGELQALRKEVAGLQQRLRQAELDDIETLRSVISALDKLLEPPPTPKPPRE